MEQNWALINLDKRQALRGRLGKLREVLLERLGSWAGDRLMFISEYNREGYYPEGVLTAEETEEFDEEGLYYVAKKWEKVPQWPSSLPDDAEVFAHDKVWVVRNLSKRVYVRSDAFGTAAEHMRGPEAMKGRSLADVILSGIHWSTHGDRGGFGWGKWVGDRFDICVGDVVKSEEGWEDVSQAIAKVRAMWYRCDVPDDD
ncbi:hypothetical protein H0H81_012572 [Sphagnurus paluster]|uniref:Uncharacterized protein n=1 Tax=Sphagnurus paluster TaxID=117069 RepID=A0A9P7KH78_9AGAR|nr:hypothetical protein H0H81_012572 [Sphagnurus paluster]